MIRGRARAGLQSGRRRRRRSRNGRRARARGPSRTEPASATRSSPFRERRVTDAQLPEEAWEGSARTWAPAGSSSGRARCAEQDSAVAQIRCLCAMSGSREFRAQPAISGPRPSRSRGPWGREQVGWTDRHAPQPRPRLGERGTDAGSRHVWHAITGPRRARPNDVGLQVREASPQRAGCRDRSLPRSRR